MTSPGHTLRVRSVCFSPNGLWALSGSDDNTIKLWDLVRGEEKRTLSGHTGSVRTVCFSPDGHWGLSGSDDDTVRLWDLEAALKRRCFRGTSEASPAWRFLLTAARPFPVAATRPLSGGIDFYCISGLTNFNRLCDILFGHGGLYGGWMSWTDDSNGGLTR